MQNNLVLGHALKVKAILLLLSKNDVENIRYAISLGSTLSAQARKYNVTVTLISKINKGQLWKLN